MKKTQIKNLLPKEIESLLLRLELVCINDNRAKPRKIIFVEDKKGAKYCLKFGLERKYCGRLQNEIQKVTALFPLIQGLDFKTLVVPQVIKVSGGKSQFPWILLKDYGNSLPWSEKEQSKNILGGKGVPLNLIPKIISLLHDLQSVDIILPRYIKKRNLKNWLKNLPVKVRGVKCFFTEKDLEQKIRILVEKDLKVFRDSKVMLNSGDFYPRNFIPYRDKIVLIDWESALVEPLEGLIAYLWMLMFGNPRWQKKLLEETRANFKIDPKIFQLMLLTKSFDEVYLWRKRNTQKDYLKTARNAMISYTYLALRGFFEK